MQTDLKVWLTPREVEQMYGISRSLLWRLRRTGIIQSATIGTRGVRVSRVSIDAYMARQTQDTGDDG